MKLLKVDQKLNTFDIFIRSFKSLQSFTLKKFMDGLHSTNSMESIKDLEKFLNFHQRK